MALRIAFDIDGVLADFGRVLRRRAAAMVRAGRMPASALPPDAWRALERGQRDRVWRTMRSRRGLWRRMPETEPGIVARVAEAAAAHRWDVIFVTDRPSAPGGSTEQQSQAWLAAHGFPRAAVYVCDRSRGELARALHRDVVIDDRTLNCLEIVSASPARALLVWDPRRGAAPDHLTRLGIHAVPSVAACLERLREM